MAEKTKKDAEQTAEAVNLADVKAQVEAMLAQARAEATRIVQEATATGNKMVSEEQKKAEEERKAYWNELVPITLFKDNNKYKDDVFVSVNDETCQIQRGKKVMIKRKFAEVLEQSIQQDLKTAELIDKKSSEGAEAIAKF